MNYNLKIITENKTERYVLYDNNNNFYAINKLLFSILSEYKNNGSYKDTCKIINSKKTENFLTEIFVEDSIKKAIAITSTEKINDKTKGHYIRNKFTIIKEGKCIWLYNFLSFLYNKYLFNLLFFASITITTLFFYKNGYTNIQFLYSKIISSASLYNIIICYLIYLFIIFIHEIGHASASFSFGIKPKEIGSGLYFIFPVLYTNITNIWVLNSKNRIKVNLGGIYFQLIINSILILILYINIFQHIVLILLVSNTSSILISFNIFFRYDGYWIYSDFFKIQNLKEKSTHFILDAILFPTNINSYIKSNKISKATIIYTILNTAFWSWIYISLYNYLKVIITQIIDQLNNKNIFTVKTIVLLFPCLLIIGWLFTLLTSTFNKLYNYYNYAK